MAFDDPTKGGDWIEDTPSTSPKKVATKKPAPVSLGADWIEDTSGPPTTIQVPPSQPGVEINLSDFSVAKNLMPSQQEVSRRVHQSLGFTDEEAQKYTGESGKSFYEGNPADLLKISETDPATLGRVVLPELTPGAIQEKRDWLLNHREQQRLEKHQQNLDSFSPPVGPHWPDWLKESGSDVVAGAESGLGQAVRGITSPGPFNPIAGYLNAVGWADNPVYRNINQLGDALQQQAGEISRDTGAADGFRKDLAHGIGGVIPLVAMRNPAMIGAFVHQQAKGRGDDELKAVVEGLGAGISVGAMGKIASLAAKALPEPTIGQGMSRLGARLLGNTSIPLAAQQVEHMAGMAPPVDRRSVANALAMGAGFALLPHPLGEPVNTPVPNERTIPTLSDRLALPAGPEPITRQTAAGYDYSPYPAQYPETTSRTFSANEGQRSTIVGQEGIPPTYEMEPGGPQAYTVKEQDQLAASRRKVAERQMPKPDSPAYAKQAEQSFVKGEEVPRQQDYTRGAGFLVENLNAPPRFTSTKLGDFLPQSGGVASRVESGNQNVPSVLSRMTSGLFGAREQRVGPEAVLPTPDKGIEASSIQPLTPGRELTDAELKTANDRRSEKMTAIGPEDVGVPKGGGEFPPEQKFGAKTSIPNQELNEGGIPTISPKLPSAEELSDFKSPAIKEAASKLEKPSLGARIAEGLTGTKGRGTQELSKDPEEMTLQELQDVVKRPQDYSRKAFEDASTEWKYRQFSGQEGKVRIGGGGPKDEFESRMEEKYGSAWLRKMSPDEAINYRDAISNQPSSLKDRILNSDLVKGEGGFIRFGKGKEHPFYSPVEELVDEQMGRRIPASHLIKYLKKLGISDDEIEWTNIKGLVEGAGDRQLSKQEILSHLKQNRVEVVVKVKGGEGNEPTKGPLGDDFTPGGKEGTYREMLLILPTKQQGSPQLPEGYEMRRATSGDVDVWEQEGYPGQLSEGDWIVAEPGDKDNYTLLPEMVHRGVNETDALTQIRRSTWESTQDTATLNDPNYQSPHWKEPNVIAHLRFHERTDAEGKKTMFVDEWQSDWHKEGSKVGYNNPQDYIEQGGMARDALPDAPFKGRAWKTLALRHAIRYAAENGFDRVAWTTGDMQNERYGLAKQIRSIAVERNSDGTYSIAGWTAEGGDTIQIGINVNDADLSSVVPEDVAGKVRAKGLKPGDYTDEMDDVSFEHGGEGKRNLYDKEIPNLANEIGEKWGVKTGTTVIPTSQEASDQLSQMSRSERLAHLNKLYDSPDNEHFKEVHSFDITPPMKEAVLEKGQPLMGKAPSFIKDESGAINLNLLGVPQAAKIIQAGQDLLKRIPDLTTVKGAKEVWSNLKWLVGSDSMLDPKTKLVAREWMGWRALDDARAYQAVKDLNKHFTSGIQLDPKSYTPEVQSRLQSGVINPKQAYFIDFEDRIQRGIPQANPQLQGFADTVKTLFNERLDTIKNEKLGGKEILDAYYNNYFPQLFKNSDKAQTFIQEFLSRTPLAGNAGGAFKAKKYPTILDGLDAGLELKFQNPAESVLTRIGQLDHFIMGHRIGEEVKNNPQLGGQWLPPTAQLPEGYSWVNDKIFTQFAPPNRRGGISIAKRFAAPTPITNVIDRVVAPSFFNNSAARGLRDINNLMLSVKLGLSSFHGFFAAQDAPAFKLAQVLEKLSKNDFAGAAKSLSELPTAPVSLYRQGSLLAKEALNPGSTGSAQHAQMVDWLTAGGTRFNQTADYSSNFADKLAQGMREAVGSFKNGEYLDALTKVPGIATRSPFALIEQVGKPIMKYEVPNIKLGVKAQLMLTEMDRLGIGATREQIREASGRVNDVVDDALGQLAYDNLFWHPALKGLTQLGVQSLGWNIGTARSVGGGVVDLIKQPLRLGAKGLKAGIEAIGRTSPESINKVAAKPIELTHHAAYVMGMIMMTGLTNTVIQGVLTKINKGVAEAPRDWKDLFIPRTGRVDDQGREERVTNPSYVKDILHFSTEPSATVGNKASPLLRTFYEQLRNVDWRHVEIVPNGQEYNPLSGDFWKGRSSHFLQQFTPISVNNLLKERAANDEEQKFPWPPFPTSKEEALPFLGVTKAPAALTDTPAELYISHTLAGQKAQRPMTEGEFERSALKNRISKGLREGTDKASDQLTKGLDEGVINTKDLNFVFGNALTHTKLERNFGALERFEDAVKAYNLASEKEKELIRPILIKKYVGESEKWAASPARTKEIDGLAQQAGLR